MESEVKKRDECDEARFLDFQSFNFKTRQISSCLETLLADAMHTLPREQIRFLSDLLSQ